MTGHLVAYAVVRDDPPAVFVAEDLDVLQRVLALRVVARTPADRIAPSERDALRLALLEERWGDAVSAWIHNTGIPIDVATERVVSGADLPADTIGVQLQFAPLFREP